MAAQPEPAWTTHEKNALLAEIIKVNAPAPHVLLGVINSMNMAPRLEEVPLPAGRSYTSCRNAFEMIRREAMSMTPMGPRVSSPMSAPLTHGKRPFPFENTPLQPGRQLAPKPITGAPYGQGVSRIEQPPKKKRGRPTKAEAQARADAQSAAGVSGSTRPVVPFIPIATPIPPAPRELPQPVQTPADERTEQLPAVSRMNISSMLAATPTGQGSASHSSSSSGKRRRGRSTRSEPGFMPPVEPGAASDPALGYESPYAGMRDERIDSPAKAAMARRRDDPRFGEQQQQGGQQPPTGQPGPQPGQQ